MKPLLMLHKMLVGVKAEQLWSVAPNSATQVTTAEVFQQTFQVSPVWCKETASPPPHSHKKAFSIRRNSLEQVQLNINA